MKAEPSWLSPLNRIENVELFIVNLLSFSIFFCSALSVCCILYMQELVKKWSPQVLRSDTVLKTSVCVEAKYHFSVNMHSVHVFAAFRTWWNIIG